MAATRYLLVVADDFGIGPATTRGILDLAAQRLVTGTVLLVNSPYAEQAVREWRKAGVSLEIGWHPCLNLDRPVLPAARVPSLVAANGSFLPLGVFLRRLALGRVRADEIRAEFKAQYGRFHDLLSHPPTLINAHKHIQVFPPVGGILLELLGRHRPLPYVRRVREPWAVLARVPGGRFKRAVLSTLGRRYARQQLRAGFPGSNWLAGITNPDCVADPVFLSRWLARVPGDVVELTCHPGHRDPTLVGRDCPVGELQRRTRELDLLRRPSFQEACRRNGFTLVSPSELADRLSRGQAHAA
jgi:predicted glycoside hydrolase/deacetylase ChbG (UPF0249 family)